MTRWPMVDFPSAVEDVTGGNVKTLQTEYLDEGPYPIIDQGQTRVAGYTSDHDRLVRSAGPLIVFGDHTTCFKFLDEPFALGADGVKVLRPKNGFDAKFLYHYLSTRRLPSVGYSRHFKFLKQVSVPSPPLEEQQRIAEVLDRADALRAKCHQILALLDDLAQSVFLDMFGDPLDNPYNLPSRTIGSLAKVQIGPFGSLLHQDDYVADGIPLINPMHITDGRIVPDLRHGVTSAKHASLPLYHLRSGDVVMARRGDMGRCAVVGSEHSGMLCGTGSLLIRTDTTKAMAPYLSAVLSQPSMKRHLERVALGITLHNLNRTIVEQLVIPAPSVSSQRTFAQRLEAVEMLRVRAQRACQEKTRFFGSLQQRAFVGQL